MVKTIVIDGKEFKVNIDVDDIAREIKVLEEEGYDYRTYVKSNDKGVSEEEFLSDIEQMHKDLEDLQEKPNILVDMLNRMSKKKDGYLKKGSVGIYASYDNTTRIWEEGYCYQFYAIRGKAISHDTIHVNMNPSEQEKW